MSAPKRRSGSPFWHALEPILTSGYNGEPVPSGMYTARCKLYPGLAITFYPKNHKTREWPWTMVYTLGGLSWVKEGRSSSRIFALRWALVDFQAALVEARLKAMRASCASLYKWMNGAWTHLADGVGWTADMIEGNHDWGQYVTVHYVGSVPTVTFYWRIAGGARFEASTTGELFLKSIPYETLRPFDPAEAVPFTG